MKTTIYTYIVLGVSVLLVGWYNKTELEKLEQDRIALEETRKEVFGLWYSYQGQIYTMSKEEYIKIRDPNYLNEKCMLAEVKSSSGESNYFVTFACPVFPQEDQVYENQKNKNGPYFLKGI